LSLNAQALLPLLLSHVVPHSVADTEASRTHCAIERRQGKFVLVDQSTNGTYVTVEGAAEILVQREEFVLSKQGWITLGRSRAATTEVIEYSFEQ